MHMGKSIAGMVCHFTPLSLMDRSYRITSLNYSPDGEDVLVSYSSEYIYLFGTKVYEGCPSKSWTLHIYQKPNVAE